MSFATRRLGWIVVAALAVFVALLTSRYLFLGPEVYFENQREFYAKHSVRLLSHIGGGIVALLIGPLQFWGWFRRQNIRLHRLLGGVYLIATIGFGSVGALMLAPYSYGGLSTHLGFGMLAVLWAISGLLAFAYIMAADVQRHREWMIRSYALTFAAVMLRLWLPTLMVLGFDFTESYQSVAWLSWVPNLFVAEILISSSRSKIAPD